MRTERQREAARRNGAKSRGPVTAAGKARSSQNSFRHGCYSRAGSPETNAGLLALHALLTERQFPELPEDAPEEERLTALLACLVWKIARLNRFESELLNAEIARQRLLDPAAEPPLLQFRAYRRLCDETRLLQTVLRLMGALERQLERVMTLLDTLRRIRPETPPATGKAADTAPPESRPATAGRKNNFYRERTRRAPRRRPQFRSVPPFQFEKSALLNWNFPT